MSINGIFFENQILTAKGLGAFGNAALSDGIVTGCQASTNGLTISLSPGYIVVCGRVINISESLSFTVSGSNRFYIIRATVNTSGTSTSSDFNQVTIDTVGGSSVETLIASLNSGYSGTDFTYDINLNGTTASTWLVAISAGHSIASVSRYNYASSVMDLLWMNNDTSASFDAQTISIPKLRKYGAVLIVYKGNNGTVDASNPRSSILCPYRSASTSYLYTLAQAITGGSGTWTAVNRQRNVTIDASTGTLAFSTGWINGGTSGNTAVIIPLEIYGVKAFPVY